MLSKNQMVAVRKAIESTYIGVCTVTEYQKVKKENKSTGFEEVIVLTNQPCKLSFSSLSNGKQTRSTLSVNQIIKIFIAPEIKIKTGSKLVITQNEITNEYKNSGEPAIYSTHQEVVLELFRGWS